MRLLLSAAGLALVATAAQAHVTLEVGEAPLNSTYKAVVRVPHGCAGAATTAIRVQIPEGVISVKPMPKPGWTLKIEKGAYARTYDYDGSKLGEGVREIDWSGGDLPDAFYDEFVFRGTLAGDWAPESTLYFPVIQECGAKAERWIEIPAAGQGEDDLQTPAPSLKLTPAVGGDDD